MHLERHVKILDNRHYRPIAREDDDDDGTKFLDSRPTTEFKPSDRQRNFG